MTKGLTIIISGPRSCALSVARSIMESVIWELIVASDVVNQDILLVIAEST